MYKKVLMILFCVFLMIFACSCTKKENISGISSSETLIKQKTISAYLIEQSNKNLISIKLPTDYTFNEKQYIFIADFVSLKINEISGETFKLINSETAIKDNIQTYSNCYISIDSKTSYVSDDVISVIFTGILNKKMQPIQCICFCL